MQATRLTIPDVLLLEPKTFGDSCGFFFESFNQRSTIAVGQGCTKQFVARCRSVWLTLFDED